MPLLTVKPIGRCDTWEQFVLSVRPNIFLQSYGWGEFHTHRGQKIWRYGFYSRKKCVGVALLVLEEARRGRYVTCPGGPLYTPRWEKDVCDRFAVLVRRKARQEKALFVRIRPSQMASDVCVREWRRRGFISSPMHMHAETTWQLDLSQSEDEIWRGMRKSTRQCLRKVMAEPVTIEKSLDVKDIEVLYALQIKTAQRQRFVPFPKEFLAIQFSQFVKNNQAFLLLARYRGKILAASMFIAYGDTMVYHYSGSSRRWPKIYASHLLQWEAIKEAKARGCRWYNFWGIAPNENPRHRFAGVTTFKKGFGGFRVDWLHARDLPVSWRYWPVWLFETARRHVRSL